MNKNCFIIHASCGEGHKKAAQALASRFSLPCVDFLDFGIPFAKAIYSRGYHFLVEKFPFLWSLLFEETKSRSAKRAVAVINSLLFFPFIRFLKSKRPDCIIATHFFPIRMVKKLKKSLGFKLLVVVTDLGVHALWADSCVDHYFVAMDVTKSDLMSLGVDENKITIADLPLRAGFSDNTDKDSLRKNIGLDQKPAILVLSGVQGGIHFLKEMVDELSDDFNFIFICGNNKKAKSFLTSCGKPSVKFFDYYENIWELMEVASLIITKPGGLTVFESLRMRKYMIFTHFIRGQEERNMEVLHKLDLGFYVDNFSELKTKVYDIIQKDRNYNFPKNTRKDIFLTIKNITGINEC